MKTNIFILMSLSLLLLTGTPLLPDYLYTVDGQVYEGKMVAFKYNVIFFNVYKFEKFYRLMRFPLFQVWKMEFNTPQAGGLPAPFDIESSYDKFRQGKRKKTVVLEGNAKWLDTGIDVRTGQEVLFSVSGSIHIDENTQVFQNGELNLNIDNRKPMPNHPTGAVIATLKGKSETFYVGDDKAPFYMSANGRLLVGINDFSLEDNTGKFQVTIYY